jgi:Zn finger protein HypA/HybF involved in hydrogenase expression
MGAWYISEVSQFGAVHASISKMCVVHIAALKFVFELESQKHCLNGGKCTMQSDYVHSACTCGAWVFYDVKMMYMLCRF